jgi:hypothetical protein
VAAKSHTSRRRRGAASTPTGGAEVPP